jgi:hypothetical protein
MDVSESVSVTSTGKRCKLCKKKGDRCHLHGGTPREYSKYWKELYEKERNEYVAKWKSQNEPGVWFTPLQKDIPYVSFKEWLKGKEDTETPPKKKSPKKSPKKKITPKLTSAVTPRKSPPKTPPAEFHYLRYLPKPALQNFMLNLQWSELMTICAHVEEAKEICKSRHFQKMYATRQEIPPPSLFLRPIVQKEHQRDRTTYEDARGTKIVVQYHDDYGFEVFLGIKFPDESHISISRYSYGEITAKFTKYHKEISSQEFFTSIKRPEWHNKYKKGCDGRREILLPIVEDLIDSLGTLQPTGGTYKEKLLDFLLE